MNEEKCSICGKSGGELNLDLCLKCETKYSAYESEEPTVQKIHRKRKKYENDTN